MIAFMYSLLESCKLNNVNFGAYIEDIFTWLMKGEKADNETLQSGWSKENNDRMEPSLRLRDGLYRNYEMMWPFKKAILAHPMS